jgi:hypothetical protein
VAFHFERRPYGPDSGAEAIQAIRERVFIAEPGVIVWHELPVQCPFTMRMFEERIVELTKQERSWGLVNDVTDSDPPSAEVRQEIRDGMERLGVKTRPYAIATGKNPLQNAAAKFVVAPVLGFGRLSLFRTREEAIHYVSNALVKR